MEGTALVDDRSGVMFDVELCIPWDAPEAVVDINSAEVVTLGSLPDKVGLFGRRKDAAVSQILQGRDSRSVRFLVPDARGLDQNFHDVTIVDMDEEREPMVTPADMTRLRDLWPLAIFIHMKWFQQDLELMRKSAKREFSQLRPMPCKFCGKVIRVNMYRHVARLHLDLVQLWSCPIAWCTTWKGSPQDCLEHLRNGHDVPWISKTANIEKYAPPGLCIGSCGQSHYRNITGCTEAVCPTPCFARTTSRDSGLFCHNRDVRKGSQRRFGPEFPRRHNSGYGRRARTDGDAGRHDPLT